MTHAHQSGLNTTAAWLLFAMNLATIGWITLRPAPELPSVIHATEFVVVAADGTPLARLGGPHLGGAGGLALMDRKGMPIVSLNALDDTPSLSMKAPEAGTRVSLFTSSRDCAGMYARTREGFLETRITPTSTQVSALHRQEGLQLTAALGSATWSATTSHNGSSGFNTLFRADGDGLSLTVDDGRVNRHTWIVDADGLRHIETSSATDHHLSNQETRRLLRKIADHVTTGSLPAREGATEDP